MRTLVAVIALFQFAAAVVPLAAQNNTTGQISGTITDPSGAVVGGVRLTLTSSTGGTRNAETTGVGIFTFPLLPPGTYSIDGSAAGFRPFRIEQIEVVLTETTTLDHQLQLADAAAQSVTVVAQPTLVQAESAAQGRTVNERAITELPLATRNFTQILGLSTGTATYLPDNTSVGRNSQNISVNGARVTNNNYVINGIDSNSMGTNSAPSLAVPAPETIQEFKVLTSLYDAAFGRSGGGNVQALTRNGTNEVHGQAYYYLRNAKLNANNTFLKAAGVQRPQLTRNTFGATLGAPIRRNKTFFFGSYQGTRERNGASIINSMSLNVRIAPGLTDDRSQQTLLNTFRPASPVTGPASSIHPVSLALLNAKLPNGQYAIPTPGPDGNYTGSTPSSYDEDQFNANADHHINVKNSISGKFFFYNAPQTLTLPSFVGAGPTVPGWGNRQINNGRLAAVQWTQILSPRLIHQLRAGLNFIRVDAYPEQPIIDSSLGLTRANSGTFPGLPQISVVGGFTIGTSPTIDIRATSPSETLVDQWSWTQGKHSIRSGVEIRRNENNSVLNLFSRGSISFLSFNDLLLGNTFVNVLGSGIADRSLRAMDYNFFIQDDWRLTRRLTLNVGLRYELDLPGADTRGRIGTFDPALYQPRALIFGGVPLGPPTGGFVQPENTISVYDSPGTTKASNDTLLHSNDVNNFAPRFGFAYAPGENDRLAIRGGYGVYYSRTSFQYLILGVTAPPMYALGISVGQPLNAPFAQLPPLSAFPTVVPGVNLSGSFLDRNIRTPYMQQWNLSTQYGLTRSLLIETAYVGTRGLNLFRLVNINQAALATPAKPIVNAVTAEVITTNSTANAQTRAPFQGVAASGFALNQSAGQSTYHSLQSSATQRLSRGLQFLISYTWSKSIDNGSGQGGGAGSSGILNPGQVGETSLVLGDQFDSRANRGVSDFDRTHRFVASGTWQLPEPRFGSRAAESLLQGWKVGFIITSQSGLPIDVVDGAAGTFQHGATAGLSRASWAAGATRSTAASNVPEGYWFNPAAFSRRVVLPGQAIPSSGNTAVASGVGIDLGDVGRNVLRGPAQNNTDFSVARRFRLRERSAVEFRSDFFNLWNQVNLANPVSDLNAVGGTGGTLSPTGQVLRPGNFGRIISTSSNPRLIQFSLRLQF